MFYGGISVSNHTLENASWNFTSERIIKCYVLTRTTVLVKSRVLWLIQHLRSVWKKPAITPRLISSVTTRVSIGYTVVSVWYLTMRMDNDAVVVINMWSILKNTYWTCKDKSSVWCYVFKTVPNSIFFNKTELLSFALFLILKIKASSNHEL